MGYETTNQIRENENGDNELYFGYYPEPEPPIDFAYFPAPLPEPPADPGGTEIYFEPNFLIDPTSFDYWTVDTNGVVEYAPPFLPPGFEFKWQLEIAYDDNGWQHAIRITE